MIVIYALLDPRTDEPRYVGKTNQTLSARINAHMQDRSACHRVHWMAELARYGLKPYAEVLEDVGSGRPWQQAEREWIASFKSAGFNLTNNTDGGDGVCGLPPETREKMRQTWIGRKHKPETLAKLRAARALRVTTDATRAKHSSSMRGRVITWGDKIAVSIRKLNQAQAKRISDRIAAGELVTDLAEEYGMHRTSISKIKAGTYFQKYKRKPL